MDKSKYYPKISIVTITYNSEKTVEETIQSVVSQNYPNLEYLIIDGGSKDSTLDIVERYRNKISFVLSEPDKGISDAFNKGVKNATGEIIGIINSDDILLPSALQAIADEYESNVDVYRGNTIIWNLELNTNVSVPPGMRCSVDDKWGGGVNHPSTFITKRAYDKVGLYNTEYRYAMDVDILYRLYNEGLNFKRIDKDLAKFRLGGETSTLWTKKVKERYLIRRRKGASKLLAIKSNVIFAIRPSLMSIVTICFPKDILYKIKYRGNKNDKKSKFLKI